MYHIELFVVVAALFLGPCQNFTGEFPINSTDCSDNGVRHRSANEIVAMTPEERMEQMVLEQMFHPPSSDDENYALLHENLVRDGAKIMPKALEYVASYNPQENGCKAQSEARLLTATIYADAVDASKVRLRSFEKGISFIQLLEGAIARRRAGSDDARTRILETHLRRMQGTSIKDSLIRASLKKHYKVEMSDAEFEEFCLYLLTTDPAYPSWTSIVGWAEMPLEEAKRYYDSYVKFTDARQ